MSNIDGTRYVINKSIDNDDFNTTIENYTHVDITTDDGSVSEPAFTFALDTDTGLYRIGDNNLGISCGNSLELDINQTRSQFGGNIIIPNAGTIGSVTTPAAITIASDGDLTLTGNQVNLSTTSTIVNDGGESIVLDGSGNNIQLSVNSSPELTISSTSSTFGGNIVIPDSGTIGSASVPTAMTITSGGGVEVSLLDVDELRPKTESEVTGQPNYITIGAGTNLSRWLRFRRGGGTGERCGVILSSYDSHNYYLDAGGNSGELFLNYNTGAPSASLIGTTTNLLTIDPDGTFRVKNDIVIPNAGTIGSTTTPAALTIASDGILTLANDLIIPDSGTIGSTTTPGALTIQSDGDLALTSDINLLNNKAITFADAFWFLAANRVTPTSEQLTGNTYQIQVGQYLANAGIQFLGHDGANSQPLMEIESQNATGKVYIHHSVDSSSTTTGGLVIAGGVGIAKKLYVGGQLTLENNLVLPTTSTISNGSSENIGFTANDITMRVNGIPELIMTATESTFGGNIVVPQGASTTISNGAGETVTFNNTANVVNITAGGTSVLDVSATKIGSTQDLEFASTKGIKFADSGNYLLDYYYNASDSIQANQGGATTTSFFTVAKNVDVYVIIIGNLVTVNWRVVFGTSAVSDFIDVNLTTGGLLPLAYAPNDDQTSGYSNIDSATESVGVALITSGRHLILYKTAKGTAFSSGTTVNCKGGSISYYV